MASVLAWFEHVISMDGQLCGKQRSDRRLVFVVGLFACCAPPAFFSFSGSRPVLLWLFNIISIGSSMPTILLCLWKKPIGRSTLRTFVISMGIGLACVDLHQRTLDYPTLWPLFVLLADVSLLLRLGKNFATALIALLCIWITLMAAEGVLRMGLFDMPGTAEMSDRLRRVSERSVCERPPCAVHPYGGVMDVVLSTFILLMDFLATRGFAEAAEKEQAAMGRTIETVEAIAELLAGYDVDTVAEMLQSAEGRLPEAMHAALRRLEHNLRAYRPYLPAILLEQEQEGGCEVDMAMSVRAAVAPGAATEEAAIVFTDIRASTAIWEAAPEAMKKSIRTHNAVMRGVLSKFEGYEVKTIGDAFMVAFEEARAAVNFALAAQERLLAADWPAALLEVPICRRTEHWGGLTVRIGVNEGPVTVETNALTWRVDYFGHKVNVAARLESVCIPGAVALPAELWARVRGACTPAKATAPTLTELKGVNESLQVCHVWPARLHGRQSHPLPHLSPQGNIPNEPGTSPHQSDVSSIITISHALNRVPVRCCTATLASCTLGEGPPLADNHLSEGLEMLMPLMEQSNGSLVTLLDANLFVSWNLIRAVTAHAESALRFAQRATRLKTYTPLVMGIASGAAVQRDVGTSSQRFVTASGPAVQASLAMWRMTCHKNRRCLYTGPDCSGALQGLIRLDPALSALGEAPVVYELVYLDVQNGGKPDVDDNPKKKPQK